MKTNEKLNKDEVGRDFWADDEFENTVAAALIACFETKVTKNRGAAPADRLTAERIAVIREEGPYIASRSRLFIAPDGESTAWTFDLLNDRLPAKGVHAFNPGGLVAKDNPNCYLVANYFRQVKSLGRFWYQQERGTLYEFLSMQAANDAIEGERRYFTVTAGGLVKACNQRIETGRGRQSGARAEYRGHDDTWLNQTETWASIGLQAIADRRHCWTISAKEKFARAHLGCMQEEVKSLLYARSLPMSSTGRKRPILHLVEAHKRRMRNGTDIDVTTFLRGQQVIEIEGTVFRVNAPEALRPALSAASQRNYFTKSATL